MIGLVVTSDFLPCRNTKLLKRLGGDGATKVEAVESKAQLRASVTSEENPDCDSDDEERLLKFV